MEERRSCLGCYSYQYDSSYSRNVCVHEDMEQLRDVYVHDYSDPSITDDTCVDPAYFIPKKPEEFCCSLWR